MPSRTKASPARKRAPASRSRSRPERLPASRGKVLAAPAPARQSAARILFHTHARRKFKAAPHHAGSGVLLLRLARRKAKVAEHAAVAVQDPNMKIPAPLQQASPAAAQAPVAGPPSNRTELIRLRHDLMKKEIEQIREDLEVEDEEEESA